MFIQDTLKKLGYVGGKVCNVDVQIKLWDTTFLYRQHNPKTQEIKTVNFQIPRDRQVLLVGVDWFLVRHTDVHNIPRFNVYHCNWDEGLITWGCPLNDLMGIHCLK